MNISTHNIVDGFIEMLDPYLNRSSTHVLDLGCGEGVMGIELSGKVGQMVMVDPSARAVETVDTLILEQNINNVSTVHGDIFAVKSGHKFDLVTLFFSLHHIVHIDPVLCRLRNLSHAGTKIAIAEIIPGKTPFHIHDSVPYDGLELDLVELKLRDNGFDVLYEASLPPVYKTAADGTLSRFDTYAIISAVH